MLWVAGLGRGRRGDDDDDDDMMDEAPDVPIQISLDDPLPPPRLVGPTRLNPEEKSPFVLLHDDNLTVSYTGRGANNHDVGVARADVPFQSNAEIVYFEVTILDAPENMSISIGVTEKSYLLNRHPGWDEGSYAYHSDGKIYKGSTQGEKFGEPFTVGDTIGCGICYFNRRLFFTRNGVMIGDADRHIKGIFIPSVGLHRPGEKVTVNFGRSSFLFDIDKMRQEFRQSKRAEIDRIPLPPGIDETVRQFLQYHGYQDTLIAFDKATNRTLSADADPTLANRKAIRDLINRGKIEEAEELIQKYFPSVLTQDDPAFALKRLQFVELIRAKKIEEAVQFSRTHLHKYLDSHGDAIKEACSLLCYYDIEKSPASHLLSVAHREEVADVVNNSILQSITGEPTKPRLQGLLEHLLRLLHVLRASCSNNGLVFDIHQFIEGNGNGFL